MMCWVLDSIFFASLETLLVHVVEGEEELAHDLRAAGSAALLDRANLTGLVLGCIEANFCKKICVGKLSPRSTQCTPLHSFWNP